MFIYYFLYYAFFRMWHEIKEKSNISLYKLQFFLGRKKINILRENATDEHPKLYYLEQSTPETILKRWKCIYDVYIQNNFL